MNELSEFRIQWWQEYSNNELDSRIQDDREKTLTNLPYLQKKISGLLPEVNTNIGKFYSSLGINIPPALLEDHIHYFLNHHRFTIEKEDVANDAMAFVRNGNIFICLHCIQEDLHVIDGIFNNMELFGLPSQYGFYLASQLVVEELMHHENLHRLHHIHSREVPSPTRDRLLEAAKSLFEENISFQEALNNAQKENTLKILQSGAAIWFTAGDYILAECGRSINERLVSYVAQVITLKKFKGNKSFNAFWEELLSSLDEQRGDFNVADTQVKKFLGSNKKRLTSFLSSSFFDDMIDRVNRRNVERVLALFYDSPEFFQ